MFLFFVDENIASLAAIRQSYPASDILAALLIFKSIEFVEYGLVVVLLSALWAIFCVHERAPSRGGEIIKGYLGIHGKLSNSLRESGGEFVFEDVVSHRHIISNYNRPHLHITHNNTERTKTNMVF